MYREFTELKVKTISQVTKEHPRKAYLLVNIVQPYINGVVEEVRGELYAIADDEGLDTLCDTANRLEAAGFEVLVDSAPLDSGSLFLFPY